MRQAVAMMMIQCSNQVITMVEVEMMMIRLTTTLVTTTTIVTQTTIQCLPAQIQDLPWLEKVLGRPPNLDLDLRQAVLRVHLVVSLDLLL